MNLSVSNYRSFVIVFDIEFEMDDIIDFSSYQKGFEILAKYGIELK